MITANRINRTALISGMITTAVILARNAILLVMYSFAYYQDSNLYVQLGKTFFEDFAISPLVMFPYPLLNALARSYYSPVALLCLQMFLAAAAAGLLVAVIGRKNLILAWVIGIFLIIDLIWGSLSRAILTDGVFATFFMFCLLLLVWHYDRRDQLKGVELFLSGLLYAFTCIIRPSHVFLVIVLPIVYLWLARSWKKTLVMTSGMLTIFLIAGLINLRGHQKFYIFPTGTSYTDVNTAFPLFVYGLFSPENGPVSRHLDEVIQGCYPGLDYQASVERLVGGAVDSITNMEFVHRKIVPCLLNALGSEGLSGQFPNAYLEALKSNPGKFIEVMYQENIVFLGYNNPYVLRQYLSASKNYGCQGIPWCETIRQSHLEWTTGTPIYTLYEKAATKILQAYLAPVAIISRISPEKVYLPYALAWIGMIVFVLLAMRGRNLVLALAAILLIQFTSVVVVAGHGFTERYASMLSPMQTTLSALVYYTLVGLIIKGFRLLRKTRLSASH